MNAKLRSTKISTDKEIMQPLQITLNGRQLMHIRELTENRADLFPDKSILANVRKFATTLDRSRYEFIYRGKIASETNKRASIYVYLDTLDKDDQGEPAPEQAVVSKEDRKRKRPDAAKPESQPGIRRFSFGDITVEFRDDGYVNATKLCKDGGRLWKKYHETQTTKLFIEQLSSSVGTAADVLISYQHAGPYEGRGTFVHPKIAEHISQWLLNKREKPSSGIVYIATSPHYNALKIGYSESAKTVQTRYKTLLGNDLWFAYVYTNTPREIEAKMHETFNAQRINGEIFRKTGFKDYIRTLKLFGDIHIEERECEELI